jgi:hypothetical protein
MVLTDAAHDSLIRTLDRAADDEGWAQAGYIAALVAGEPGWPNTGDGRMVTRQLQELERSGLVERRRPTEPVWGLTDAGVEALEALDG